MVAFVVLGTVFAGGQKEAAPAAASDGPAKIKLTAMHQLNITDDTAVKNWDIIFPAFEAANPNIEIKWEFISDEPYHDKLQAMSVADQLPDLMFLWPAKRTGMVTSAGRIKDLRPWIKGHEDEFASKAMDPQGVNGEMYELPEQVTSTHVVFTNDRILKELGLSYPKTMKEMIAQGEKIRAAGYIPIAMDNGDGWQMQSCFLSTLTERAGGMAWLEKAISGKGGSFSDPEFVAALKVIQTLSENDMFSPGINQASYGLALDAFVREEAVYLIDGGWRTQNLATELTEEQMSYVSLNAFPDIPGQKGMSGSTAAVAGTGFGMNAKLSGAKADAAWEWIWFWAGPVGSEVKQSLGWIPSYKLEAPADLPLIMKKLITFLGETPMTPVIDAVMDGEGMGVLHPALQEMMLGAKTPQQVANEYEAWVAANDTARK